MSDNQTNYIHGFGEASESTNKHLAEILTELLKGISKNFVFSAQAHELIQSLLMPVENQDEQRGKIRNILSSTDPAITDEEREFIWQVFMINYLLLYPHGTDLAEKNFPTYDNLLEDIAKKLGKTPEQIDAVFQYNTRKTYNFIVNSVLKLSASIDDSSYDYIKDFENGNTFILTVLSKGQFFVVAEYLEVYKLMLKKLKESNTDVAEEDINTYISNLIRARISYAAMKVDKNNPDDRGFLNLQVQIDEAIRSKIESREEIKVVLIEDQISTGRTMKKLLTNLQRTYGDDFMKFIIIKSSAIVYYTYSLEDDMHVWTPDASSRVTDKPISIPVLKES